MDSPCPWLQGTIPPCLLPWVLPKCSMRIPGVQEWGEAESPHSLSDSTDVWQKCSGTCPSLSKQNLPSQHPEEPGQKELGTPIHPQGHSATPPSSTPSTGALEIPVNPRKSRYLSWSQNSKCSSFIDKNCAKNLPVRTSGEELGKELIKKKKFVKSYHALSTSMRNAAKIPFSCIESRARH